MGRIKQIGVALETVRLSAAESRVSGVRVRHARHHGRDLNT